MKIAIQTKFIDERDYPRKNLKYYSSAGPKKRLTDKLLKTCKGYCMYCGKKVVIERDYRFQLEHTVDKAGNINQKVDCNEVLKHCKYNLAISCSECNQVCKKMVDKVDLGKLKSLEKCPSICTEICKNYNELKDEYEKMNAIILQPLGNSEYGDNAIVYNLLDNLYEPDEKIKKDDSIFFIQNHIIRFKLNGERFSEAIVSISSRAVDFIDSGVSKTDDLFRLLKGEAFENIIGEDFVCFLEKYFSDSSCKRIKNFCSLLVILDSII